MKILQSKYPKGTLVGQQTDGRYIDATLYENLKILAKAIKRDMTWLGIISSSTLEVGTGKSVFSQQLAEAYLSLVNEYHGLNLDLTMKNIIFKPKDIIKRAFQVPRYSVVIMDEWDDAHYWSELGISLRQFFRKCRQLNLFILLIIPNFFQLPSSYAISRSVFFIDVKFQGEFERGYFSFYNFEKKKELYVKGKKTQDYGVVLPNFHGRFTDGYVVDEKEYRSAKLKDMIDAENDDIKKLDPKKFRASLFCQVYEKLKGKITMEALASGFGVSDRTASRWFNEEKRRKSAEIGVEKGTVDNYINNINQNDEILEEPDDLDEENDPKIA